MEGFFNMGIHLQDLQADWISERPGKCQSLGGREEVKPWGWTSRGGRLSLLLAALGCVSPQKQTEPCKPSYSAPCVAWSSKVSGTLDLLAEDCSFWERLKHLAREWLGLGWLSWVFVVLFRFKSLFYYFEIPNLVGPEIMFTTRVCVRQKKRNG